MFEGKRLGFGLMRLPLTDANDKGSIDIEALKEMVDTFMEQGFTYFDTAWMYCAFKSENAVKEALTNVAMQIAALSPKYVSTADVSEEYKAHEKEILMAQIQNDPKMAGKPEKVIEGAVSGRLNKELKEVCLLEQVYVKAEDGKQTVAQYLAQVAKENNANLTVKGFVRFETGEGIEKKVEDFAAEVAAQLG